MKERGDNGAAEDERDGLAGAEQSRYRRSINQTSRPVHKWY